MIDNLLSMQAKVPELYTDIIIKGIILVIAQIFYMCLIRFLFCCWDCTTSTNLEGAMALFLNHPEAMEKACVLRARLAKAELLTKWGFDVPRHAMLVVNAWAIQRDPEVWKDPTEFKPERYERWVELDEGSDGYKLIAFGAGRLIQSFEWERIGEENLDMDEGLGLTMRRVKPF
ncbi:hypothetical protein PRUPE_1G428900 [Prunus persica]|uniref:Uncharacterized protein n=1 Tax=Prunus persica TaxID=3760 RepID=A0A251RBV0_PRUPE|nr:hypothetical protein PRUPE_1G428900 [Prunus persica]